MGSVYNRGTKSAPNWWVKYKDENRRWRSIASEQPSKEAAKVFVGAIEARIKNGMVGIVEKTDQQVACATITVRQLYDRFMAEYTPPNVKDIVAYRAQTSAVFNARILPTLASRTAASITSVDVEKLRDELLAREYAGGSVAWAMARLSKLYVWGRKVAAIDCGSPIVGVEYPEARVTLDYLSKVEVAALLRFLETHLDQLAERQVPQLFAMVATAVYAGLRKGELLGLRWVDVSLERAQVTIARSYTKAPKSGKPRHLPAHPSLVRILRAWQDHCPKTDEGLVFPAFDVCDGWKMGLGRRMFHLEHYLKAAGCHVPFRPWHSLRHTFASHFMMGGGNILTLQKLLGHADLTMTLIYAHLAPDHLASEVARMSFDVPEADVASLDEERRRRAALAEQEATHLVRSTNTGGASS